MPRIRTIKPEAFQSETLSQVSLAAERTFFGLSTQVDDRGRISDKPAQINGLLWAMRGHHTAAETDSELSELQTVGLVCRYTGCDARRYLHLVTWDDHQRVDHPSRSRLPRCREHAAGDYCGRHDGECPASPDTLAKSREPSRQDRGPRTVDRGPLPPTAARATAVRDTLAKPADTVQDLLGEWIDHCRKRPPDSVIGRAGKHVKALLEEGIGPDDIRRGLAAWHAKGADPSALPSFVNQAMNSSPRGSRQAETEAMFDRAMARAEAREAHDDTTRNGRADQVRQGALPAAAH